MGAFYYYMNHVHAERPLLFPGRASKENPGQPAIASQRRQQWARWATSMFMELPTFMELEIPLGNQDDSLQQC